MREAVDLLATMRELGQTGVEQQLSIYAAFTRIAEADVEPLDEPAIEAEIVTTVIASALGSDR